MTGPVHHPYDVTRSSKGQEQQRKLVLAVGGACRGSSPYAHTHTASALSSLPLQSLPHKGALWGRPEGENPNGYLSQREEIQKSNFSEGGEEGKHL